MRRVGILLLVLCAAACAPRAGSSSDGPVDAAPMYAGDGDDASCQTAFVFGRPQEPARVLDALGAVDVTPAEVRFNLEDATGGATGGSIGDGTGTPVDVVAAQLDDARTRFDAEPRVIAVRTVGVVDSLGDLDREVHSRVLVPEGVPAALSAPEDGGVQIVGGAGACS